MKEINIHTKVKVYESIHDLGEIEQQLITAATEAMEQSYSPYSKFTVGAAALLEDGTIIKGSNQENAAYTMCICAERVALAAVSNVLPKQKVLKMAVTAQNDQGTVTTPVSPCGACRQVLSETEYTQGDKIELILFAVDGPIYILASANDLLPLSFDPSFL